MSNANIVTVPRYGLEENEALEASLSDVKEGSVILAVADELLREDGFKFVLNRALLFKDMSSTYKHIAADIMNEDIFTLDQLQEGEYFFRLSSDGAFLGIYEDDSLNQYPETYRAFIIKNGQPVYMPITIEGLKKAEVELAPMLEKCFDLDSNDFYVCINDESKYLRKADFDTIMGDICSGYSFDLHELWDKECTEFDEKRRFGVFEV